MSESVTLSSHLDLSSKVVAVWLDALVHFRATTPKQKAHGDAVVSVSVTSTPLKGGCVALRCWALLEPWRQVKRSTAGDVHCRRRTCPSSCKRGKRELLFTLTSCLHTCATCSCLARDCTREFPRMLGYVAEPDSGRKVTRFFGCVDAPFKNHRTIVADSAGPFAAAALVSWGQFSLASGFL